MAKIITHEPGCWNEEHCTHSLLDPITEGHVVAKFHVAMVFHVSMTMIESGVYIFQMNSLFYRKLSLMNVM